MRVIKGYLRNVDYLQLLSDKDDIWSGKDIADIFRDLFYEVDSTEFDAESENGFYYYDGYAENIQMRMYVSDIEMPIDELKENLLMQHLGVLKMDAEYYGYSEWTILGLDIDTLKLGGHNLLDYFHQSIGKYIYIEIEQL